MSAAARLRDEGMLLLMTMSLWTRVVETSARAPPADQACRP